MPIFTKLTNVELLVTLTALLIKQRNQLTELRYFISCKLNI